MNKSLLACLLLSCMTPIAFAHGDTHKHPKKFDPAAAEQKPFGIAGDPKQASQSIKLSMGDDMRFTPGTLTVKQGATVKLIITNKGKLMHEMVLGTAQDLKEHAELMKKFPNMEHDEAHMAHVEPGHTESIVWRFNKAGEFDFACLMPGHFEAGMVGKIKVLGKASTP